MGRSLCCAESPITPDRWDMPSAPEEPGRKSRHTGSSAPEGILSGAASFDTPDMQKLLLEGEGVKVEWTPEGYRVDLKRFGWRNTLEEAEALRARFEMEQI